LNLGPAEGSKLNLAGNFTISGWFKLAKTDDKAERRHKLPL
jgi:hypothetical protein